MEYAGNCSCEQDITVKYLEDGYIITWEETDLFDEINEFLKRHR